MNPVTLVALAVAAAATSALALPATATPERAGAGPGPDGTAVRHVVAVSVDGLNPRALSMIGLERLEGFRRLERGGASTRNARTVVELTQTLPNHSSMVTGRKVSVPGGTGVTFNQDDGSTMHASAGEYVSSVFDVTHDRGLRTALLTTKDKFNFLNRTWNADHGAPDTIGADDGRDKIDVFRVGEADAMTGRVVSLLAGDDAPAFTLLHLRAPDSAGHAHGWLSPEYLAAVREADADLVRVLDAIADDPERSADTVLVVTSDHGGLGDGHSDPTLYNDYRIGFWTWGVGVDADADLYALNPDDRLGPGRSRPRYPAAVPPIRNAEVADLALALLGLPPVPGSTIGVDQGLDLS